MEILIFLAGFFIGALCVFVPFKVIDKSNRASQDLMLEQMKLYFENTANKIFKESSSELSLKILKSAPSKISRQKQRILQNLI